LQRIERIRDLEPHHHFSLLCRDLSEIAYFAKVDNPIYRFLKQNTPGPYTFILPATHEVPKLLMHPKKKTIGIRISRHIIPQMLTETLRGPITASSLILPGEDFPLQDAEEIDTRIGHAIDWIIDLGEPCVIEPKIVVDCTSGTPIVLES
jgi:tRNA threonylcarbamoyl adenosine modification protein (Sua5/YciO/YrdC/YwlC family)